MTNDYWDALLIKAENGDDESRNMVCEGYWSGNGLFPPQPEKLMELGRKGWEKVQWRVCRSLANGDLCFPNDPIELIRLAEEGWRPAQYYVVTGYTAGFFGFPRDHEKEKKYTHRWKVHL